MVSRRKGIDALYSDLLPRGGRPWVYLSIFLPTRFVDVNVHPTKREVKFLHEEEIAAVISRSIEVRDPKRQCWHDCFWQTPDIFLRVLVFPIRKL